MDSAMIEMLQGYPEKISKYFENYKIKDGVQEIVNLARACNKYFNDSEPWSTVKKDKEKCGTALNICANAIFTLGELLFPVLPFSSDKILKMLNAEITGWDECGKNNVTEGHKLNSPEILFQKIEDGAINMQMEKLNGSGEKEKPDESNLNKFISIEDFYKVELKTAEVISAEKIEKSDKLLKLRVKLDNGERQVIAGIAKSYSPEQILGKKIVIVANLKPAKLMGLDSQGMILAVQKIDGSLDVLSVDGSVMNGTRVK
jgi:methionyl-tRNA synthetase